MGLRGQTPVFLIIRISVIFACYINGRNMKKIIFNTLLIIGLGSGVILGFSSKSLEKPVQSSPNIIFIMSDDHAEKAISSYGGSPNHTPNIDRLATEGVRFTQACVSNSICAPSRAVILTGKHSHMNGLLNNASIFDGTQQTFPKLLQEAGYQTALIGKWHLKSAPTGFNYWNILPGQGHYYNPDFNKMGETSQQHGYVTQIITEDALDWLRKQEKSPNPFCLLIQHKAPHRNWMPAPENLNRFDSVEIPVPDTYFDDYNSRGAAAHRQRMKIDRDLTPSYDLKLSLRAGADELSNDGMDRCYSRMDAAQRAHWNAAYRHKNDAFHRDSLKGSDLAVWKYQRYMQDYLATVQSVDESVGAILDYLDQAGLAENTLVIYTSDQGFYLGEHGWFDKRFMYEESLSTPLLIRYPAAIKANWVCDRLVQNLDFAETLLDYAGLPIPPDMQGRSMRPLLNQSGSHWRDALYYHYYEYPAEHSVMRHYGIRTLRYKLIHFYYDADEWELYDLATDPSELVNLYGNPAYADLTRELKKQLIDLQAEYEVPTRASELAARCDTIAHLGTEASYTLVSQPSPTYFPSGKALNDGLVFETSPYWSSGYGYFCGYEGTDMLLKIDLQAVRSIHYIGARFLSRTTSWIYPPSEVRISFSVDGRSYQSFTAQLLDEVGEIKIVGHDSLASQARYIKITARNHGIISAGNPGAGSKAWLFCDEVIVR